MSSPQETAAAEASAFVVKLNEIIIFPTIALLSSVALLLFIWGCAEYFLNAANEEGRKKGVKHITWGIIGLVIMLSAFTILEIVTSTFGLDQELECVTNPSAGGCAEVFAVPEVGVTPDPAVIE